METLTPYQQISLPTDLSTDRSFAGTFPMLWILGKNSKIEMENTNKASMQYLH